MEDLDIPSTKEIFENSETFFKEALELNVIDLQAFYTPEYEEKDEQSKGGKQEAVEFNISFKSSLNKKNP